MSEDTVITNKRIPNPQKIKWTNVAYYDNFKKADEHRNKLEGLVKVRRCGPFGTKFVVKTGVPIKEPAND